MNRADAFTYLTTQLRAMLTEVDVDLNDDTVLDTVIDDALLMVGVPASGLSTAVVADEDWYGFRKVLRYVGIQFVYDAALNRVDIQMSDPNVSKSRSQFVRQLENSIKGAKEDADPYITVSVSDFQAATISFGENAYPPGHEPWVTA